MRRGVRLGVDIGSVRIGIAKCDPDGILATPVAVLNPQELIGELRKLVDELTPIEMIIGYPIDLRGEEAIAAKNVRLVAQNIMESFPNISIRLVDERLTTRVARTQLQQNGHSTRSDKELIDAIAATVLLEDALEFERRTGNAAGQVLK